MNEKTKKTFCVTCLTLLALAALFGPAANSASAAGAGQTVTLAWNLSTNSDITNYNLYYGVASGIYTEEIAVGDTNAATLTGLVAGTTYYFTVTAVGTTGMESAYSNETNYVAPDSTTVPIIAGQPANQTILSGGQASFSVTASGAPTLSYQWIFNGTSLSGATNASLTLTDVLAVQAGNYAVLVSNSLGWALSSNATLTLATTPFIAAQPASQSVEEGCSAAFHVAACGTAPLSYQWWYNGVALASQTNASVAMTGVQTSEFGNYSVVVNNGFGAVTSAVAILALASPPTAEPYALHRFAQGGVRLNVSALTSNDTVAAYDILTVIAVSSNSAAGGAVTLDSPWLYYAPPAGAASNDTFTYTVSDGHCGTTVGTVTVIPDASSPQALNFAIAPLGNGSFQLSFDGEPGGAYQLQCLENLTSTNWTALTTMAADDFGVVQFTDSPATNVPVRFYRAAAGQSIALTP
jgi:hypothetical protein